MKIPRTKVCGVTRLEDLDHLAASAIDAVGINLVPTSPRCVLLDHAEVLARRAGELGLLRVAVVMNPGKFQLAEIVNSLDFELLQLHGEETPDCLDGLGDSLRIIKALSWTGRQSERHLAELWQATDALAAFLVDAYSPGVGGGTGRIARWDVLMPRPTALSAHPLILAGGLNSANVAAAIEGTLPYGVDTASGVESKPGFKDAIKVRDFANNARHAFAKWQDQQEQ
ncbi:MAG: phosphoribosylanthranilate isomerase [Planctomycetales bacterium]|nr:phosphoribosylanthranilate isomerase [Planctomycetales bacterium]